ncbi:MAG: ApaG protein [Sphingobacteriales bacterium]|jgi:ApaG protein
MVAQITQGVKVTVKTQYESGYSNPTNQHFMFSYEILIENMGDHTVQLLRREWRIFDSAGNWRTVEGEGVVGQQPILNPGETHKYVSGCNLNSGIGKMTGKYSMKRIVDGHVFEVSIPEFQLICPAVMN